jgi:hypothetical protein
MTNRSQGLALDLNFFLCNGATLQINQIVLNNSKTVEDIDRPPTGSRGSTFNSQFSLQGAILPQPASGILLKNCKYQSRQLNSLNSVLWMTKGVKVKAVSLTVSQYLSLCI